MKFYLTLQTTVPEIADEFQIVTGDDTTKMVTVATTSPYILVKG
jgi:hypothetical protein